MTEISTEATVSRLLDRLLYRTYFTKQIEIMKIAWPFAHDHLCNVSDVKVLTFLQLSCDNDWVFLFAQCYKMLVKYQDDIRRWFYTFQTSNPLKWICANKILTRQNSQGKYE